MKKRMTLLILCLILCICSIHYTYASSYVMHTIEPGDTYWKIASSHDKDVASLQTMNQFPEDNLSQGQLFKLQALPTITVEVNDSKVYSDQTPYIENNRTFVPTRFIAEALNIDEIYWDENTKTAVLKKDNMTIQLPFQSTRAYINESPYDLDAPINIIDGRIYVPIRFVSEAFDCDVNWDPNNYKIDINTSSNNIQQSNATASATALPSEDLYWLSRIVEAEAGGEPYEGKLAVANVVINRKRSIEFPNTIKSVVFDGYQFSPVLDGTIYKTPSAESIQAATEALLGKNNIGECLYFLNPRKSTNFWIMYNKSYYTTISLHDFYY